MGNAGSITSFMGKYYFGNYGVKVFNDNEAKIFKQFLVKYGRPNEKDYEKINKFTAFYMPKIEITIDNLANNINNFYYFGNNNFSGDITFKEIVNKTCFINYVYVIDRPPYNKCVAICNDTNKKREYDNVYDALIKHLKEMYVVFRYIFTKHNDVYLPELAKQLLFVYFDIIHN